MAGDSVRINGLQIGWASVKLKINGNPYRGVTAIEYADGVEAAYAYGTGRHYAPRGTTAGKYTPEPFVITAYKSTAGAIRKDLNEQANGRGVSSVIVPIVLQYVEKDDAVITVEALGSRLVKNEGSDEESPEALTEKLTFMPTRYKRNGIALYDTTEAGA